jgi:hypothetical protein
MEEIPKEVCEVSNNYLFMHYLMRRGEADGKFHVG